MGANRYCYFTPYEPEANDALQKLRLREFEAGRYDPALRAATPPAYSFQQSFPPGPNFPSPGAQHASIDDAIDDAAESGTGSILDIMVVAPEPAFLCASLLSDDQAIAIFGSGRPNHADVSALVWRKGMSAQQEAKSDEFWEPIDRGEARIVTVYKDGAPSEYFFGGYSID